MFDEIGLGTRKSVRDFLEIAPPKEPLDRFGPPSAPVGVRFYSAQVTIRCDVTL